MMHDISHMLLSVGKTTDYLGFAIFSPQNIMDSYSCKWKFCIRSLTKIEKTQYKKSGQILVLLLSLSKQIH